MANLVKLVRYRLPVQITPGASKVLWVVMGLLGKRLVCLGFVGKVANHLVAVLLQKDAT